MQPPDLSRSAAAAAVGTAEEEPNCSIVHFRRSPGSVHFGQKVREPEVIPTRT